jgi:4-hydroxybenzoyl-CoA thioesterase
MRTYRYKRRLHWSECDPGGIIFFPHYARWMVEGLNEMLLFLEIDPTAMLDANTRGGLPVVQLSMQFFAAPSLHAHVWHEIRVDKIGGKSLAFVHRFLLEDTLLMEAHETRVWATHGIGHAASTQAITVPDRVRALLMDDSGNLVGTRT